MARQWVVNSASGARVIGGLLLAPGEGTWIEDPAFAAPISQPQLVQMCTPTQLAALASAGYPVPEGVFLVDPLSGLVYGQSDGQGGYEPIGSSGNFLGDFTWAARPLADVSVGDTIGILGWHGANYGRFNGVDYDPIGEWVLYGRVSAKASSKFTDIAPELTVTANTAFAPVGGAFTIPAGVLAGADRRLSVMGVTHRRGASPSSATNRVYLGTAGTVADSLLASGTLSNTDGRQSKLLFDAWFPTATSGVADVLVSTGTNLVDAFSTNINTAAQMFVTFAVQHDNAADGFSLPRVRIAVR